MIDLHAHPLAAIDDGVQSEEEALEFCRIAAADGISTLAATPHIREGMFPNRREDILEGVRRLRALVEREGVPIEIVPGAEVYLEPDLGARVRQGEYLTLNDGGHYLLLELPTRHLPAGLEDILYHLRLEGLTPLLAHPERIYPFQEDAERLARLVELGALVQITGASLLGQFGSRALDTSRSLLRQGLVHVMASDAHNTGPRAPRLSEAVRAASELVGEPAARRLVEDNPRAILAGAEIEARPERPVQRSGWREWLRGLGRA